MENVKRGTAFDIAAKNVNLPQKSIHKGKIISNIDKKTVVFDLD